MTASLSRPPPLSPAKKLYLHTGGVGCSILVVLAIAATLRESLGLPKSIGLVLDFGIDLLATILFLWVLGIVITWFANKNTQPTVVGYAFPLVVAVVAIVMLWNLVAIYAQVEVSPIRPLAWEPAARPGVIGLAFLVAWLVLGAIMVGVQKRRGQPKP
jgi:hypothetical protein